MKRSLYGLLTAALVLTASGCNEKKAEITSAPVPAEVPAASAPAVSGPTGALKGRVLYQGQAPAPQQTAIAGNPECAAMHPGGKVQNEELLVSADGGVANVFVYIKEGLEGRSFPAPASKHTVSNKNCVYVPHVSGVQVGQTVELLNEDATLHNMHSYSTANRSWNVGLPFKNMKLNKSFDKPEVMVKLKCDVHPWMLGYVGVVAHPFFAVTGADGGFRIEGIPAGEYTVEFWHEKLGVRSEKIRIEPQGELSLDSVSF